MTWQDIVYIGVFVVLWYLLVTKVLPKFGVST